MQHRIFAVVVCAVAVFGLGAVAYAAVGTTTSMAFSPNPVTYPGSTTVTITVTASSGSSKPTGSVALKYQGTALATLNLNANGVATASLPTSGYPAGVYALTAVYAGNGSFSGSSSPAVDLTLKSGVSVAFQAIPNPVTVGQTAKLQANVSANDGGTPTGTVSFYVGSTVIGQATLANGSAVLSAPTTGLAPGSYPVYAHYNGDTLAAAADSATQTVVLQAPGGAACGTGNESILNGTYAFEQSGWTSGTQVPFFAVGSFVANGKGAVTGGEMDTNLFTSEVQSTISNLSVYSVGADGRGCLTLVTNNQATHTYRFSLIDVGEEVAGVSGGGRLIEFDDKSGSGMRSTGGMVQANTAELGLSHLEPNYSFGVGGFQETGGNYNRASLLGTFAVNTSGAMSSGETDMNNNGVTQLAQTFSSGTISAIDSYGRGTMTFTADDLSFQFAVYMVNEGFFFVIGTNTNGSVPVMDGEMHVADTGFSATNVPAAYVEHVAAALPNQAGYEQVLALTKFSAGNYTSTRYEYTNGTASTVSDSGTYTVSSNGRLVLDSTHGGQPEIYYVLYKGIAAGTGAYVLGLQSTYPTSGGADVQETETYSDAALAGNYGLGHDLLLESSEEAESGEVVLSSAGAVTGTVDESTVSGLLPAQPSAIEGDFSFDSSGVSDGSGLVGLATGSNIYFLEEDGSLHPLFDMTIND